MQTNDIRTVGQRVALFNPNGRLVRYDTVRKVHKNGNIVLEGFTDNAGFRVGHIQQYRPMGSATASETGDGYHRRTIRVLDDKARQMIAIQLEKDEYLSTKSEIVNIVGAAKSMNITKDQLDRIMVILKEEK